MELENYYDFMSEVLQRPLTAKETEYVKMWFGAEVALPTITRAYGAMMKYCEKISFAYMAKVIESSVSVACANGADNYRYLEPLSDETRQYVINKIERGEKNPYHSIMAVLEYRVNSNSLEDEKTERERYKKRFCLGDEKWIEELFSLCYKRMMKKESTKRRLRK